MNLTTLLAQNPQRERLLQREGILANQGSGGSDGICNPVVEIFGCGEGGVALAGLIANLWRAVIVVGGLALLLYLVWGGLKWVMAGGDAGKVDEAKQQITQGIIGMAILAASVAIAFFLGEVLNINLLNPTFLSPDA